MADLLTKPVVCLEASAPLRDTVADYGNRGEESFWMKHSRPDIVNLVQDAEVILPRRPHG